MPLVGWCGAVVVWGGVTIVLGEVKEGFRLSIVMGVGTSMIPPMRWEKHRWLCWGAYMAV